MRYPQPKNEDDFEEFCLVLLREYWKLESLNRFGHRGESQYGVDLVDTAARGSLRAVQCKHHEPTKTLPPSELRAEVGKAKTFPEAIGEFFVVTTAKKSVEAQLALMAINREHTEKKLFVVHLLTWDDLERLVDSCPTAQAFLIPKSMDAFRAVLREEFQPVRDLTEKQSGGAFDGELDEARNQLRDGNVQLAWFLLTRLRTRSWDQLSSRQRCRWCTLGADTKVREGNSQEAANLLFEAKSHQPDDDNARSNEIVAFELIGDRKQAFDLAMKLVEARPHLASAFASALRTVSSSDFAALFASIPEQHRNDAEILIAATAREDGGLSANELETIARKAVERAPDDGRAWSALGEMIWRVEELKTDPEAAPPDSPIDAARVDEARNCFARVAELAKTNGVPEVQALALMRRGTISAWRGENDDASVDLEEAHRLAPALQPVLIARARLMAERENYDDSIKLLREVVMRSPEDDEANFFLAVSLRRRGGSGDREEAMRVFARLGDKGQVHVEAANDIALELMAESGRLSEAKSHLALVESRLEASLAATWAAGLHSLEGKADAASESANDAIAKVNESTSRSTLRRLAKLLSSLGRFVDALQIWERLAVEGVANDDGRRLVDCAGRLGRDERVLKFCASAREQDVFDQFLLARELMLLDRYDPDLALKILEEMIRREPDDKHARVYLLNLALRHGKKDLAFNYLSSLPTANEVQADEGRAVVDALMKFDRSEDAIAYAYDLLRTHFRDGDAHLAFRDAMLFRDKADDTGDPEVCSPGVAVCLFEEGNSSSRWLVLEDSTTESGTGVENEIRANSALAKLLTGKRVGDKVALTDSPGLSRVAEVREIVKKEVFRFRDVLDQWQYRFPERQEMWMMRVGKDNDAEPDLSSVFEMMKSQQDRLKKAEELYETKIVPVHLFGFWTGKSDMEALAHLAGKDGTLLRCANGSAEESAESLTALQTAVEIVLDLTALTTLMMLEELDLLRELKRAGKTLVVSHGTMAAVRQFAETARNRMEADGLLGGNVEGPLLVTPPPEVRANIRATAEAFQRLVEENCEVRPSTSLASVDPDDRKQMESGIGTSGLESLGLASTAASVIWTDDFVVAIFGREKFGAKRIWTQAVCRWLNAQGIISNERQARITMRLMGWEYVFTSTNPEALRLAGNEANWNPDQAPFKQAIRHLSLEFLRMEDAVVVASFLVAHCYLDAVVPETRQRVLQAIAESLARRKDGEFTLATFEAVFGRAFGLNAAAQSDARTTLAAWKREYLRRVRK